MASHPSGGLWDYKDYNFSETAFTQQSWKTTLTETLIPERDRILVNIHKNVFAQSCIAQEIIKFDWLKYLAKKKIISFFPSVLNNN